MKLYFLIPQLVSLGVLFASFPWKGDTALHPVAKTDTVQLKNQRTGEWFEKVSSSLQSIPSSSRVERVSNFFMSPVIL